MPLCTSASTIALMRLLTPAWAACLRRVRCKLVFGEDSDWHYTEAEWGVEASKAKRTGDIEKYVNAGWRRPQAEAYRVLTAAPQSMAKALRDKSPRFAASTYELCSAFFYGAKLQFERRDQLGLELPPMLYANLEGPGGLARDDPSWSDINKPDSTWCCSG